MSEDRHSSTWGSSEFHETARWWIGWICVTIMFCFLVYYIATGTIESSRYWREYQAECERSGKTYVYDRNAGQRCIGDED